MTKRFQRDDYAVMEAEGKVAGVPTFLPLRSRLTFVIKIGERTIVPLYCEGSLAKAFRNIVRNGTLLRVRATPHSRLREVNGKRVVANEWEAIRMTLIAHQKPDSDRIVQLPWRNKSVIDGLMPGEDEYEDVGYVDPEIFEKLRRKLEYRAKVKAKAPKGEIDDD